MVQSAFRGMTLDINNKAACVTIERTFDEGEKRDEWSQQIINLLTANTDLQLLTVNLGKCPIISSTVIAGLVHLYDYSNTTLGKPVTLIHCTKHVINILKMMHLDQFFIFENALERN